MTFAGLHLSDIQIGAVLGSFTTLLALWVTVLGILAVLGAKGVKQ